MTAKKLKFLAFSDIHGDEKLLKELSLTAEKEGIDGVFICGDFSPRHDMDSAPPNLVRSFKKLGKPVFLLHGNWETQVTIKALEEYYKAKNLHGYYAMIYDVGIFGAGGADIGPFPTSEEEIFEALKRGFDKIKSAKKKIMVTHSLPAGSVMEKLIPGSGSAAVRKAIDSFKPDIVVCGHIHEASGIEEMIGSTKVINVARKGKVIEI